MRKYKVDENNITGRIHSIESFGTVDGPGVRCVIFFQGCPLRCLYCHNPDSWDTSAGNEVTVEELVNKIDQYKNFIKSGGVTLSGGEPLLQPEFSKALLEACHDAGFHTAVDTSGAVPLSKCGEAVDAADLILLDIKAIDHKVAKLLTGKSNESALEMLRYCEEREKPVWIRHVLIPEWTTGEKNAHELGAFLKEYKCIEKVELLPFHKMGEYKWELLCLDYKFSHVEPPSKDEVDRFKEILQGYGLKA